MSAGAAPAASGVGLVTRLEGLVEGGGGLVGRHPVVEHTTATPFVPNDSEVDGDSRLQIITGPNMAGKSVYLRQVALITLLAQTGSYVPADAASLGVVDRIFTRASAAYSVFG